MVWVGSTYVFSLFVVVVLFVCLLICEGMAVILPLSLLT